VCRSVHPARQAAHDRNASPGERAGQLSRDAFAVWCGAPRSDDRGGWRGEQCEITDAEERGWWVVQLEERGGIFVVAWLDELRPASRRLLDDLVCLRQRCRAGNAVGQ
jgi:hypothetical protein